MRVASGQTFVSTTDWISDPGWPGASRLPTSRSRLHRCTTHRTGADAWPDFTSDDALRNCRYRSRQHWYGTVKRSHQGRRVPAVTTAAIPIEFEPPAAALPVRRRHMILRRSGPVMDPGIGRFALRGLVFAPPGIDEDIIKPGRGTCPRAEFKLPDTWFLRSIR